MILESKEQTNNIRDFYLSGTKHPKLSAILTRQMTHKFNLRIGSLLYI